MKSPICDLLGVDFPLVAFTHCRDVVVEVKGRRICVWALLGITPKLWK